MPCEVVPAEMLRIRRKLPMFYRQILNMRYYRFDGTFRDDPEDVEFGWFFEDIVIDESTQTFKEHNEQIRDKSRLLKFPVPPKSSRYSDGGEGSASNANDIEESVDVLAEMELFSKGDSNEKINESIDIAVDTKPQTIYKIEPNIKIETPTNSISNQLSVEGFIENPELNFYKQIRNFRVPLKEEMMRLINPINPETKALLSVVSYAKYKSLNDKETNDSLLKTINFKTTNSKRIIGEHDFCSSYRNGSDDILMDREEFPDFNFILNDGDIDVDKELVSEIRNYHATKEDNMLSLMMELIITDMDSNLDMSELNNSVNEFNSIGAMETSDLGNSIHSSLLSKEGNGSKESKEERRNRLELPNRSDILSSIGLTDDIDKSIEYFTKEKVAMHQQLLDIKRSFEEDGKKVETLINQAISLQNDLRETTYLENLIQLLNGKPEKVKDKKLPFRIFHKSINDNDTDFNRII